MTEFLLAQGNLPFTIALAIMAGIALLEVVGTLMGFSSSAGHSGDVGAPDLDAGGPDLGHPDLHLDAPPDLHGDVHPHVHIDGQPDLAVNGHPELDGHAGAHGDAPADADGASAIGRFLGWLGLGRLPAMIWLVVFLTSFGLTGLVLQRLVRDLAGGLLPAAAAAPVALFLCLPVLRVSGGLLARILPRDETSAVPAESFVGQLAVVTLGTARHGQPAEAKLKDIHGQTHYVLVEPESESEELETGSQVLLVRRAGAVFSGVRNPYGTLLG